MSYNRFLYPSSISTSCAINNYVDGDGTMSVDIPGATGALSRAIINQPDPYTMRDLTPYGKGNGYSSTAGKSSASLPTSGTRILMYVTGQSNAGNPSGASAYTPANPNSLFNINIFDGTVVKLTDPVIGADGPGACFFTRVADALVTDGYANSVTVVAIPVGATTAANWASMGICYNRISAAINRVAQQTGFTPTKTLICRHQGESDTIAGTTYNSYQLALNNELGRWASLVPNAIQFVAQVSFENSVTSSQVIAAQASVVNNTTVFSLGNFDSIDCTGRSSGCIDYNSTGSILASCIARVSIEAYLAAHP